ncbi:MAG: permease [Gammaproteobacteria bacterium]|nr:permease [Gammaproteobacteria bacterium]
MSSTLLSERRISPQRLWSGAAVAAIAWIALYQLNEPFWDWAVFTGGGLDPASRLGQAVHFFAYDTTKILLLLSGIIFLVAILRSFTTLERTRALLGGRAEGVGNIAAAGLGVVTPFCSCSAVPAFIGFVAAGVPLGITLSFLIASPMVNEVAVVLMYGLFGWKVAALYIGFGLLIAIVAGNILGRLKLEKWVEPFVYEIHMGNQPVDTTTKLTWVDRFAIGRAEVRSIVGSIWPYLLVGIGIGAVIHGWAPQDLFARWAGPDNPLAVPIAVLVGIPLYSNAAGALPLVQVLAEKGLAMGTVLAFMMSIVALSLPEMVLLRKVLRPKLLATFVAVVGSGILLVGYLFNAIL